MSVEISLSDGPTNTCYAPLAVLGAYYRRHHILAPLDQVQMTLKTREFSPPDKLKQVLLSILTGCETLSEVIPDSKPKSTWLLSGGGLALPTNLLSPAPWTR